MTATSHLHVGVTGSRRDIPDEQAAATAKVVDYLYDQGARYLHHGMCTGFDYLAHRIVAPVINWHIFGYPGVDNRGESPHRMPMTPEIEAEFDEIADPDLYMARNAAIIAASGWLTAGPAHPEADGRSRRSGAWATVRMARAAQLPIFYAWPDGRVTQESFCEHVRDGLPGCRAHAKHLVSRGREHDAQRSCGRHLQPTLRALQQGSRRPVTVTPIGETPL